MTQRPDIILEAGTERAIASIGGDWGDFRVKRDIAISAALHLVLLALLLGLLPHWHDYAPPPQAVQLVIEERPVEPQPVFQPEPPPPPPPHVIQTSEDGVKGNTERGGAAPAMLGQHPSAKPTPAAPTAPGTTLPPAAPAKSAAQMSFGGVGTTSLEHNQYLAEVKHQILQFGYKLDEKIARGRTGDVMVAVLVSNNGTLVSATIETSSGYRDIDRAATQMVELAAPFPPLPTPSPSGGVRLGFEVGFPVEAPPH
jgi:protein TonB